jgi:hypothetical protein
MPVAHRMAGVSTIVSTESVTPAKNVVSLGKDVSTPKVNPGLYAIPKNAGKGAVTG